MRSFSYFCFVVIGFFFNLVLFWLLGEKGCFCLVFVCLFIWGGGVCWIFFSLELI